MEIKVPGVIIFVLWVGLMAGCGKKEKTLYDIPLAQALESVSSLKAEEYIASIRYVPLETTDSCFLGDIYKIIPWGDFYYVSDLEKVFLFSTDGKFLRSFLLKYLILKE